MAAATALALARRSIRGSYGNLCEGAVSRQCRNVLSWWICCFSILLVGSLPVVVSLVGKTEMQETSDLGDQASAADEQCGEFLFRLVAYPLGWLAVGSVS